MEIYTSRVILTATNADHLRFVFSIPLSNAFLPRSFEVKTVSVMSGFVTLVVLKTIS
jgi:hypothetical protein